MSYQEKIKWLYQTFAAAWKLVKNYKHKWTDDDWEKYINEMTRWLTPCPDKSMRWLVLDIMDRVATYMDQHLLEENGGNQ